MVDRMDEPLILVVDDERDFLTMTRMLLQRSGFRVDVRTRAPQWRELLHMDPALVLMDLLLDGENGADVCRAIKQHERLARIPIILVSGCGEDRLKKEVSACNAEGFLTKPISRVQLLQLASHYVARRKRMNASQAMRDVPPAAQEHPSPAPSTTPDLLATKNQVPPSAGDQREEDET